MTTATEIARHYSRMRLETAPHQQIIWLMHARAAQFVKQAATVEAGLRRFLLTRAQNLLAELETSLKVDDEISKGLFYLYDYCYCLIDTDNPENHKLAHRVLSTLRDTFGALLKKRI
jgi:flagellin-specific chaperone FliS